MWMVIDRKRMDMNGDGLPAVFEAIHFITLNSNLYELFSFSECSNWPKNEFQSFYRVH